MTPPPQLFIACRRSEESKVPQASVELGWGISVKRTSAGPEGTGPALGWRVRLLPSGRGSASQGRMHWPQLVLNMVRRRLPRGFRQSSVM
jgi:hypothetical protein